MRLVVSSAVARLRWRNICAAGPVTVRSHRRGACGTGSAERASGFIRLLIAVAKRLSTARGFYGRWDFAALNACATVIVLLIRGHIGVRNVWGMASGWGI